MNIRDEILKNISNIEKAYIQIHDGETGAKGEFANEAAYNFFTACEYLDIPYEKFYYNDMGDLNITKNTVIAGGVGAVQKGLAMAGVVAPAPLDIPKELYPFARRNIQIGTVKHFVENGEFPMFVKPTKAKMFTGMVVSSSEELDMLSAMAIEDEELEIMTSNPVKFVSEFRVFVIEGEIYDCRRYSGDYTKLPNLEFIDRAVKGYESQPIAFGIDFGVTDKGETMLIEANDGYSLGTYGFENIHYFRMTCLRWNELVWKNKFGIMEPISVADYVLWLNTDEGTSFLKSIEDSNRSMGDHYTMHEAKSMIITKYAKTLQQEEEKTV